MAEQLCVDPSRISRWEHGELPPTQMIERINRTFNVNAFEWLVEVDQTDEQGQSDASPRVIRLKATGPYDTGQEDGWRSRAVDLLERMADMVAIILRSSRGGRVDSESLTNYPSPT